MHNSAIFVKKETGIEFKNSEYYYGWDNFFKNTDVANILDIITALFRLMQSKSSNVLYSSNRWRLGVQRIFDEERLSYQINDKGGVRFRVDEAFETERVSAVKALSSSRYAATRAALDQGFSGFDQSPPDTRAAIRGVFDAVETLFKLMFVNVSSLGATEINHNLAAKINILSKEDFIEYSLKIEKIAKEK